MFNAVLGRLFDLLLWPFQQLSPLVGLSFVSLLTAAAMLLVVKATSDQQRLAEVKRAIAAALFEIRMFKDDLPALFRAQAEMLKQNAVYLRLSLVPLLWLALPMALLVAQLESRYGYAGLALRQPVLVKMHLRDGVAATAALDAPPQIRVLTPPVWFPSIREMVWQIQPEAAGEYELQARVRGEAFTKSVDATDRVVRRSPERAAAGFMTQLTNPSEPPLPPQASVTSISVRYPSRAIRVLGWEFSWVTVFFALSIAFALLLKARLGVTL